MDKFKIFAGYTDYKLLSFDWFLIIYVQLLVTWKWYFPASEFNGIYFISDHVVPGSRRHFLASLESAERSVWLQLIAKEFFLNLILTLKMLFIQGCIHECW